MFIPSETVLFVIKQEEEAYVCIYSERNGDVILFHHQGGVDIGDVDEKALRLSVEIDNKPSRDQILSDLLINVTDAAKKECVQFV
jgi:ATP citrate (pro-S)-lyase